MASLNTGPPIQNKQNIVLKCSSSVQQTKETQLNVMKNHVIRKRKVNTNIKKRILTKKMYLTRK